MSSINGVIISPYPGITASTNASAFEVELAALGFRPTTITIARAKEAVWRGSPLSNAIGVPVKMTWADSTLTPTGNTIPHANAPNNTPASHLLRPLDSPIGKEQPALLSGDIILVREDGADISPAQIALLCDFAAQVQLPNNPDLGPKLFSKEFSKLKKLKVRESGCKKEWEEVENLGVWDPLEGITGNARKNRKKQIRAREAKEAGGASSSGAASGSE